MDFPARGPRQPDDDRIEILECHRHEHKLRRGHLRGNHFTLRVEGIASDAATRLPDLLDVLSGGVPNYYGPQRFGYGDDGVQRALEALQRRGKKGAQTFAVSVVQAALFNLWLGTRIQDGHFYEVVCGDVLKKRDTGGLFTNEDPSLDQERMDRGELVSTGPIYGPKMRCAQDLAGRREDDIRGLSELTEEDWSRLARFGQGSRRVSRIFPDALDAEIDGGALLLSFGLPAGSYATVVVDELTH